VLGVVRWIEIERQIRVTVGVCGSSTNCSTLLLGSLASRQPVRSPYARSAQQSSPVCGSHAPLVPRSWPSPRSRQLPKTAPN
jgi:hypothetical protein